MFHPETSGPCLADSRAPAAAASLEQEGSYRLLTAEELSHLKKFGFVAVSKFVPPDEVNQIRSILNNLFDTKAGHKEGAHFNFAGPEDDPNAPSLPQIIGVRNYAKGLRKTRYFENAFLIARQILGPEARFGTDHTLMKPALNGPATPWHQDEAFRHPDYDYNEISIWMPLQAVDQENGCMEFLPGSHVGGILPHRSPNNDPRVHVLECHEGFEPRKAVACPIAAGGFTIHTGRTLHGAGPNRSKGPRLAYVLNFYVPPVPAKTPRSFPWLKGKDTGRLRRMRAWWQRGGIFVEAWRMLRDMEVRDYGKIFSKMARKARISFSLFRANKSS